MSVRVKPKNPGYKIVAETPKTTTSQMNQRELPEPSPEIRDQTEQESSDLNNLAHFPEGIYPDVNTSRYATSATASQGAPNGFSTLIDVVTHPVVSGVILLFAIMKYLSL